MGSYLWLWHCAQPTVSPIHTVPSVAARSSTCSSRNCSGSVPPSRLVRVMRLKPVATGFNRNTLTNREGGTDPEQFRDEQVLDRAATLGTVWMGLTVGCAQCHNHKYDPISQREFYQLTSFFNTQEEVNIQAPLPGELGPYLAARPEYDRQRK